MSIQLDDSWLAVLKDEFQKDYMLQLKQFLQEEKKRGYRIYPPGVAIFNAFCTTPFDKVSVVILGQDPYHGAHQAHGLSFSVQKGVPPPPSLQNIYKELENDIEGFRVPNHGDLTYWAKQGVLLLNATLTVRAGSPGSHQNAGWTTFTDRAIIELSQRRTGIVFLLWGKFAQAKKELIDDKNHHILTAAHPSPYSANNGFFGCQHFSKTNAILQKQCQQSIDWQV